MLITKGKYHWTYHVGLPFAARFVGVVDCWFLLHGCTELSFSTSPGPLILWLDHITRGRRERACSNHCPSLNMGTVSLRGPIRAEGPSFHPWRVGLFSQLRFPLLERERQNVCSLVRPSWSTSGNKTADGIQKANVCFAVRFLCRCANLGSLSAPLCFWNISLVTAGKNKDFCESKERSRGEYLRRRLRNNVFVLV